MSITAITGANWGDEGKGKITDFLAEHSDIVVRFQGGNNAGHTIINSYGKFALHLLPSGVCNPGTVNILGPGVAVNIPALLKERAQLLEKGVPEPTLLVSDRAQVVLPYHLLFDAYEEERLGQRQFGSTKSGMAPFYSDKYYKTGIQICELFYEDQLSEKLDSVLAIKNTLLEHLYAKPPIQKEDLLEELRGYAHAIRPFVCDTTAYLHEALQQGKKILLEGQLGALRDPDHGIYPYSTSSSTLAGFSAVGAGIPPHRIAQVIAVTKAYSSCVGAGPFVTEIFGSEAEELRKRGGDAGEYGATTGRPRRMGWFDAVATRYGCQIQGATEIALTNMDVLGYLDEIPVCTGYEIDGKRVDHFPVTPLLDKAKPVFTVLPGWKCDLRSARSTDDLPVQAKEYIIFLRQQVGIPIRWISVGPRREETIEIHH